MKALNRNLRIGGTLFYIVFKNNTESLLKVFLDLGMLCIRLALLFFIYKAVFAFKGGEINGENFTAVAWSMYMYFAFMITNPRVLARHIQADIKSGSIQDLLVKPFSYLQYRMFTFLGTRILQTILNATVFTTILYYVLGPIPQMYEPIFYMQLTIVIVFGFILSFFIFSTLGLLSFWLEDIVPLQWIIDKFIMILGGSYLPIAFFPPIMKALATWSPFGASQFITHTTYSTWGAEAYKLIGIQMVWIAILGIVLYVLMNFAMKRVVTNGG